MKRGSSNGQPPFDVLASKLKLEEKPDREEMHQFGLENPWDIERNGGQWAGDLTIKFALLYKCVHIENGCPNDC
jgi:hypothetical protein